MITNTTLKNLPDNIVEYLVAIVNELLHHNYLPKVWKAAIVMVLPEARQNHHIATKWWPISLLNSLGKLFERVVAVHVHKFTENTICNTCSMPSTRLQPNF